MKNISVDTVTLASGLTLPYAVAGDPAGIPVVFVHAYVESWRYFDGLLERLPPSLHGYAPTQRGHGDAENATGYTLEEFADDVVSFMDAVGLQRAALVGSSSGGLVVQLAASNHPHRVTALVLLGAPATLLDKPSVAAMVEDIENLTDPLDPTFVEDFVRATSPASLSDDRIQVLVDESLKAPARVWKETLRGLVDAELPVPLERITAPTLLIWGDHDTFVIDDQETLLRGIPRTRHLVYQGGGHNLHLAAPNRVVADIDDFLVEVYWSSADAG